jgi:ATP-dependent helicase YprA (DUF1998 family)
MHDTTGGVLRIEYFERILRAQVERAEKCECGTDLLCPECAGYSPEIRQGGD